MLMQPIQRASENLGGGPFGIGADAGGSYFVNPEVAARTGYGTAVTGTSFFPGAGIVDAYGGAVDITGQPLPSFSENIREGQFTDAGLQALGVAGDIATIAAPLTLGTSALVGAMMKAPRAATKYKFENPIKVYQGRSKKGIKDFINPTDFYGDKKVSFGTNELVTAEQFANKQTVSYPGRARDGSEGPTKTTLIPGDVAELEFDIQNPLEVNRKDIGFKRDNEKAAIAEARAKGHDGLKIVYDNSDKIDFVAFDSEQVRVVNPSLYPDRDYAYSPTSAELADKATDVASDVAGIAKVEPQSLPMDEVSRTTRANKLGFTKDVFHGTFSDIDEFDAGDLGTHVGSYEQANSRIRGKASEQGIRDTVLETPPGANILPLKVRLGNQLEMPDVGMWNDSDKVFSAVSDLAYAGKNPNLKIRKQLNDLDEAWEELGVKDQFEDLQDWIDSDENREMLDEIKKVIVDSGYDSIKYENAVEVGTMGLGALNLSAEKRLKEINSKVRELKSLGVARRPKPPDPNSPNAQQEMQAFLLANKQNLNTPEELAEINKLQEELSAIISDSEQRQDPFSYIILDNKNIRSRFADFDPEKADEPELLSSLMQDSMTAVA
jgi:hypothetical protein